MSHNKKSPWENIQVANLCKNDWSAMEGNDCVRSCADCNFNVYNLNEMEQSDAEALLIGKEGKLPRTLFRRQDRMFMTANCPGGKVRRRILSNPEKTRMWQQLPTELGENYKSRYLREDFHYLAERVEINYRAWTIILDTDGAEFYTQMRAPFVALDGFRFKLFRRGFFADIRSKLGMPHLQLGIGSFDRNFVIQGNEPTKVKTFFSNAAIRRLVEAQAIEPPSSVGFSHQIEFSIRDNEPWYEPKRLPANVDELRFAAHNIIITDIDRLILLLDLFAVSLDYLCVMGAASPEDPEVII